jgi:hypothetical protein
VISSDLTGYRNRRVAWRFLLGHRRLVPAISIIARFLIELAGASPVMTNPLPPRVLSLLPLSISPAAQRLTKENSFKIDIIA